MIGRHYTPVPLAAAVVRRTLAPLVAKHRRGRPLRVLDPACGDGVFLREVARFLGTDEGIVGVDLDGAALERAREAGLSGELVRADALRHDWAGARFDAVIGNPPWASWSGRHALALPEADRAHYAGRFATFSGWPSLHGLFLELALELADPQSGRVGLLLPAQVCDLDGYGAVRAHVRAHAAVEAVLDCGEAAFPGVVQPCCALVLARGSGGSGATGAGGAGGAGGEATPDPAPFAHAPSHPLDALPKPPKGMFGDIGVHTGNCAKKLLRSGSGMRPVREGRDVHAYRLDAPRKTLVRDLPRGEGDYFRVGARARYEAVPILLRQTAARPVAALHVQPAYFRNSVLACHGLDGVPSELVVAWLNSGAVADYHRSKVREAGQRAFPQLKLKHLRDLPMPDWNAAPDELVRLAGRVARDGALDRAAELDAATSAWLHTQAGRPL